MDGISQEKVIITNIEKSLEVGRMIIIKISGGQSKAVLYTVGNVGSPSDLDWGELGNYGTDSEVGRYLENHDGTCDYEDMNNQTDIAAYKVFAEDNIVRKSKEAIFEPLNNSGGKCSGWEMISRK